MLLGCYWVASGVPYSNSLITGMILLQLFSVWLYHQQSRCRPTPPFPATVDREILGEDTLAACLLPETRRSYLRPDYLRLSNSSQYLPLLRVLGSLRSALTRSPYRFSVHSRSLIWVFSVHSTILRWQFNLKSIYLQLTGDQLTMGINNPIPRSLKSESKYVSELIVLWNYV